jgi:acylphosphatase
VKKRVRVLVSGQVQGVGFRWACRVEAIDRGVAGFVRNLPDGRVEAAFEGEPAAVDDLAAWCRQGPGWGAVSSVEVSEERPIGDREFRITR